MWQQRRRINRQVRQSNNNTFVLPSNIRSSRSLRFPFVVKWIILNFINCIQCRRNKNKLLSMIFYLKIAIKTSFIHHIFFVPLFIFHSSSSFLILFIHWEQFPLFDSRSYFFKLTTISLILLFATHFSSPC